MQDRIHLYNTVISSPTKM